MSGWGPWVNPDNGEVHIVPCDKDLKAVGGHERSQDCACGPRRDDREPLMFVHNDRERGGCDG